MMLKARWTEMDLLRKGLLLLLAVAIPLFAVVTAVQCSTISAGSTGRSPSSASGWVAGAGRGSARSSHSAASRRSE